MSKRYRSSAFHLGFPWLIGGLVSSSGYPKIQWFIIKSPNFSCHKMIKIAGEGYPHPQTYQNETMTSVKWSMVFRNKVLGLQRGRMAYHLPFVASGSLNVAEESGNV